MNRKFALVILLASILGVFSGTEGSFAQTSRPEPVDVSLIQLIANPNAYHGKVVRFIGFFRFEFEGDAVYLHREDFEQCLTKNAVWIDVEAKNFKKHNNTYVLVEALFDAKGQGHGGLFSGELKNVTRLEHWTSRKELEKQHPELKRRQ